MASILVIDDDPAVLATVDLVLKRAGHVVTTAINAYAGLAELERGAFDLVIVDLFMPEMDGLEAITRIGLRHPNLPVIVLSGHGFDETAAERPDFLAREPRSHISLRKPFRPAALLDAIGKCLAPSSGKAAS